MAKIIQEIAAYGVDEALTGLTSDPWGASLASAPGLRVPAYQNAPSARYLFLLATFQCTTPVRIVGLRQGLTIGANDPSAGGPPLLPNELFVTTPSWRFPDGNVSWHLVSEPNPRTALSTGPLDTASFSYLQADQPALLYSTASYGAAALSKTGGPPLYYPVGMTGYTPPTIARTWSPLGGLGCFYDLKFPYDSAKAWRSLDIPVPANSSRRISLYASVLQTSGSAPVASTSGGTAGWSPEELFRSNQWANPLLYWRILGALILETVDDCDAPTAGGGGPPPLAAAPGEKAVTP